MEKYENLGLVGEGSYGIVMKCRHKATGTLVAIKKFLESEDDRIVKRIANREIKMLRQLRHENLVNLIDVFKRKKKLYLVFEFVDYTLLDDLEKNPTGLEETYAKKILFQVLRGIEFCHNNDVIHRDIKPENILVSKSGIVKLCDFGFARPLSGQSNSFTDYVATRWYRAPELLVGDTKYGRPVDIWAIGCLTSEMFAGDPLFPGDSDIDQLFHIIKCIGSICSKHIDIFKKNALFKGLKIPEINDRFSLEKRYTKMPKDVITFIKRCLDPTPEERPSCIDLLHFEIFNSDYFATIFINEIKMKVYKEREKNPLLKNLFKSGSSLSKHESHNNEIIHKKTEPDKPPIQKRNSLIIKQQTPITYQQKQNDNQQSSNMLSNQENEMLGMNKNTAMIDEDVWEDVRPLTSRKERVASRAGRISVIKDAFDNMVNETKDSSDNNTDEILHHFETPMVVDIERSPPKTTLIMDHDDVALKLPTNSNSPSNIAKLDNNSNTMASSPHNIDSCSQDIFNKAGNKTVPTVFIQLKTVDNSLGNEKSSLVDSNTNINISGSSPVLNDTLQTQHSHNFSISTKKTNLHTHHNSSNNNSLLTSKNQVGNYPTIHQQYATNPPFNYNVLKQMSTNFSQRPLGMPSENTLHSYFPIIGKDSKYRSNNFHFPSMAQSNKTFLNPNSNTGLKSPSPMTNERSGFYYNGFNKKKPFVNTRPNPIAYQDNNISLPELKGAEIPIIRNQQVNSNTKYKYITQKPSHVVNDPQGSTNILEPHES